MVIMVQALKQQQHGIPWVNASSTDYETLPNTSAYEGGREPHYHDPASARLILDIHFDIHFEIFLEVH